MISLAIWEYKELSPGLNNNSGHPSFKLQSNAISRSVKSANATRHRLNAQQDFYNLYQDQEHHGNTLQWIF